jgi:hypothetical protein
MMNQYLQNVFRGSSTCRLLLFVVGQAVSPVVLNAGTPVPALARRSPSRDPILSRAT